ncbi:EAL domain-containing protein [Aquisalimonas asiatica]|uniref:cyclic-guanylate-specific phosphodiesterase n=1 Tax=Aquisalimonas asiatica TaxID=406100 RepID=A0A1H8UNN6_9GAMM|nr:EAL domain-containing protein [Aquisalimonas asiatica]SEP04830.1 diguanylate cyclase (GGDEF) domain-containing protein [Aquisalimonas asiatica]
MDVRSILATGVCRRRWLLGVLAVSVAAAAALYLHSAQPPEQVLRVGLYENPPKIYTDSNGDPAGFFPRLLQRIATEEEWALEFAPCTWSECLTALRRGDLDLMPDVAASEAREAVFDFHDVPVTQGWSQFYAQPDSEIRALEDLEGLRVAVLAESQQQIQLEDWAAEAAYGYELLPRSSMADVLEAVASGAADAGVTNNFFGRRNASDFGLVETPVTFGLINLYFAAPPGRADAVLDTLDRYITRWKTDPGSPYYEVLYETTTDAEAGRIPVWLSPLLAAALGLATLAATLAWLTRWQVLRRTRELEASRLQLQHLLDSSPAILYSLRGPELEAQWVSGNIRRILGVSPKVALQRGWWRERLHPDDRDAVIRRNQGFTDHLVQEYRFIDPSGRVRHIRDEKQVVARTEDGLPQEVIGTWTDLTDAYEQRARVHALANYDARTGLPNRAFLRQRIDEAIAHAQSENRSCHVVFFDLDGFKRINETLGEAAGDQVLEAVGARLNGAIAECDTVARVGDDGFCAVLGRDVSRQSLAELLDGLLATLREPHRLGDHELIVTASIGVASFPGDGETPEALMSAAELAVGNARRAGGDRWAIYQAFLGERSMQRLLLENDLRRAVINDEFVLHYQPQYRLDDGRMIGMEVLVRWQQPERGMVPPDDFIPLAEQMGLIQWIDRWVITESCRQLADWDARGFHVDRLSVNLSTSELEQPDLVDWLIGQLAEFGLAASRLEVEITETMLMASPENAVHVLQKLGERGVHIAMDDFGTGYSNLAHMERLPLDRLKIDRSLVWDIGRAPRNDSIIRAIIALAAALELPLVAEGVETDEQRAFLLREGCQAGQGFLFARPSAATQLLAGARPSS